MLIQSNATQIPIKNESCQLCCFSPPYWGLRKYSVEPLVWGGDSECEHVWGDASWKNPNASGGWQGGARGGIPNPGQDIANYKNRQIKGDVCFLCNAWRGDLGLEPDPEMYLDHMMLVMAEVWRVLRNDGVCFVNLGDCYSTGGMGGHKKGELFRGHVERKGDCPKPRKAPEGIKPKSLCLIPQKFAIRCQEAGWIIRSEIIWAKPNPMPESCKDRPTRSHEQVWFMVKQGKYFWDQDAVREGHISDGKGGVSNKKTLKSVLHNQSHKPSLIDAKVNPGGRNIRDVWTIPTEPTPETHFATWPSKLVSKMIRAASAPGDIVLDPFCGTAKTVIEAERPNRVGIGLDLSWSYLADIATVKQAVPLQKELI